MHAKPPEPGGDDQQVAGLTPEADDLPLPEWFARRGPKPGWLASHWSLILALIGGIALVLNTLLAQKLVSAHLYNEVTTAVAWLSTSGLFLQSRQKDIVKVARWRAKVRKQTKEEKTAESHKALDRQIAAAKYAQERGLCGDIGTFGHICTRWVKHEGQHQGVQVDATEEDRIYASWG
jgi:hypothetical protein